MEVANGIQITGGLPLASYVLNVDDESLTEKKAESDICAPLPPCDSRSRRSIHDSMLSCVRTSNQRKSHNSAYESTGTTRLFHSPLALLKHRHMILILSGC